MSSVRIPLKPLAENLEMPRYAHENDGAVDLRANEACVLEPFQRALIPCGFAIAIPEGYAGLVIPRSGLAIKHGISVLNAPGLIDSGYRGEVGVVLVNLDPQEAFTVKPGDRIAQLAIVSLDTVIFETVSELPSSERGTGGFGSSGID